MNKKFIYAALASLAMVGCAKTEGVKPVKQAETIAFRPTNTSVTRAETAISNLDSFLSVGVNQSSGKIYFGLKLTKPTSGTNWDTQAPWLTDNEKFLAFNIGPANDNISFTKSQIFEKAGTASTLVADQAKNADDALFTVTANSDGNKKSTATYVQKQGVNDNRNLDKGVDVVIGTAAGTLHDHPTGVLNLDFKHIYSQILIQADNKNTKKYTVKVLGAAIAYVNSEGTFNFTEEPTVENTPLVATGETNAAWTLTPSQTPVVYGNAWNVTPIPASGTDGGAAVHEARTLTDTPQDILHYQGDKETQGFYIIPQKITSYKGDVGKVGTGAYLKVFVQISTVGANGIESTQKFPSTPDKFGSVMVPMTLAQGTEVEFKAGHKYLYKIHFFGQNSDNGGGLSDPHPADNGSPKGDVSSNKRTGGGDPTTTDNAGTNPDIIDIPTSAKPGEPVINSKTIQFNVSVDGWDTTSPEVDINL